MAPKNGKAAAKAKEGKDLSWARKQLDKVAAQRLAGPAWLSEPHSWHQEQLQDLLLRLEEGSLSLSTELREGVEFYLSQFEDGQVVSEEEFYVDRDLYAELQPSAPEPEQPYTRILASEVELAACEELKAWTETTPHGLTKLRKLMEKHADCAEVQEAGLTRSGGLLAEVKAGGNAVPSGCGFSPASLCPLVLEAMGRFPRDAGVQRVACSVLRGIVVTDGGCTVVADAGGAARAVDAVKAHLIDPEVCRMGAAVLYAMVQKTDPASPERLMMRTTKAHQVLAEALQYHPTDRALDRACRVTMPELKG